MLCFKPFRNVLTLQMENVPAMASNASLTNGSKPSPVAAAEVAGVRQSTGRASLLPPRVYHDPAILEYELEAWFANGLDLRRPRGGHRRSTGQYFLTKLCGENLIVVRDNDGERPRLLQLLPPPRRRRW